MLERIKRQMRINALVKELDEIEADEIQYNNILRSTGRYETGKRTGRIMVQANYDRVIRELNELGVRVTLLA